MEITPDIHKIDGVRGGNCYLAWTPQGIVLIDSGMPGNAKRIVRYAKGFAKAGAAISYIVLTHADIDHVGSAAKLKELTGAQIALHFKDASILSGRSRFKAVKGPIGVMIRILGWLIRFRPVKPDIMLEGDSELAGLKLISTPGHTQGSICVYLPGKAVFAGDALRSDAKGNPKPPSRRFSADAAEALASLNTISNLHFEILLPGHGQPVIGNASTKLKSLTASLR